MNGLQKNAKTSIFGHFGPKWPIFGQNGQNGIFFFQKNACNIFSSLQAQALTNCKVSEKSNERFSSNRVTDVRTDVNP